MKTPRDNSIGAQMHTASQLIRQRIKKQFHNSGYTTSLEQFGVLETLKFKGDKKMSELASILVKDNAAITRMVDVLERDGFVLRDEAEGDRRAKAIHITKQGLEIYDKLLPIIIHELQKATSCITKEEQKELMRIVKKIIKYNE